MDVPIASLLIPVYNVERYLRECLDSAVGQTLSDIEIIAIDDGSTDSCPAILEEYRARDPRIRVITQANAGYGAAMNRGLDAARGKYIAILESDDFFDPDALEVLCGAAEKHGAQVAKADFWLHWSEGSGRESRPAGSIPASLTGRVSNPRAESGVFEIHSSIWATIYRRDFLEENDIRFLESPGASYQDTGFHLKVWACATRAAFVDRAVVHYRQDNPGSSVKSPGKAFCVCDEFSEVDRWIAARPDGARMLPARTFRKYVSYMWNYRRLQESLRVEFLLRFSEEFRGDETAGLCDLSLFSPEQQLIVGLIMEDPMLFHELCGNAVNQ